MQHPATEITWICMLNTTKARLTTKNMKKHPERCDFEGEVVNNRSIRSHDANASRLATPASRENDAALRLNTVFIAFPAVWSHIRCS